MSDVDVITSPSGVRNELRVTEDKRGRLALEIKRTQRVDKIMDAFREESETINRKARGRIVARIPEDVYNVWKKEWKERHADKWTWHTFLAMRINNPDYKRLRNSRL